MHRKRAIDAAPEDQVLIPEQTENIQTSHEAHHWSGTHARNKLGDYRTGEAGNLVLLVVKKCRYVRRRQTLQLLGAGFLGCAYCLASKMLNRRNLTHLWLDLL